MTASQKITNLTLMGIKDRKEREKERRRNEIIDGAEKVFFKNGYQNSSMDEIAKQSELSKGTLYLYFKSKDDLYFAINIRGLDKLSRLFRKYYDENKSGFENIQAFANAFVDFSTKHQKYFEVFLEFESSKLEGVDPEKAKEILLPESPLMIFMSIVEQGQKDESIIDTIAAPILSVTLWSQFIGALQFAFYRDKLLNIFDISVSDFLANQIKILQNGIFR